MLIERITVEGLIRTAEAAGLSDQTGRKLLQRRVEGGYGALIDRCSRPDRARNAVDMKLAERIEKLRRMRLLVRRIGAVVGRSIATFSGFLTGTGLSSLKALDTVEPVVGDEREAHCPVNCCTWPLRNSNASCDQS